MSRRSDDYYQDAHDERVEPNADLDETHGGMPPPDWARSLVHTGQKAKPVGDPTVWSGTVITAIDSDPILGTTPRAFYGNQIVLAQAADRYSRSWSLSGTLELPAGWWANDQCFVPPFTPSPAGNLSALWVFLSIVQGIERVTIEQQICLAAGGWVTGVGLCNQQSTANASYLPAINVVGPYFPVYADVPATVSSRVSCAFACVGALIGNTISIRPFFVRGSGVESVPEAKISCLITPYAPGAGL